MPDPTDDRPGTAPAGAALPRRRLLTGALGWGGVAAAAAADPTTAPAANPAAPAPAAQAGVASSAFSGYGQPSAHEQAVQRRIGLNHRGIDSNGAAWTPLEQLAGTVTPNGLHFVRNHHGTPDIDPATHRLALHGLVQRPLQWDVASLQRYPQRARLLFIECAGNSSAGWFEEPVPRPVGLVHGLVSCAEWTGVPLRMLLDEAGLQPGARWLVATGGDAGAFQISLPLDLATDAEHGALLALWQNGERLRPENGYPLRLVVPGVRGVVNVKWLRSLELTAQPAMARDETAHYTELRPDGRATQFRWRMGVKSVITTPSHGQRVPGPGVHELRGLAWSGHGRITRVEVSADGGAHWRDAQLQGPALPHALTRFHAPWEWDGQAALLQSRATDERGQVQPTRAALVAERGRQGSYHYHAIVTWEVDERGIVSHAYA
jgi:sulfane dehydrogenase subunit SoxC